MNNARVLVIDDDEAFRRSLRSTLELAGYTVRDHARAVPALRALDAGGEGAADLVLTDLRLPAIKLVWPDLASRADKEGWPAARFLAALADSAAGPSQEALLAEIRDLLADQRTRA